MASAAVTTGDLPHLRKRGRLIAPTVSILPDAERRIRELAPESEDGRETGGILIGRGPDAANVITVERAGDPGPGAQRQPGFFLRDLAHAQDLAAAAWTEDQGVWVGEWHTHPTGLAAPSTRDLTTYAGLLADPELSFGTFVSIIVVPDPDWANIRLLVWVLGGATRPSDEEYRRP
jgi:integrative and conjugative element protein (TIGR02256 family)